MGVRKTKETWRRFKGKILAYIGEIILFLHVYLSIDKYKIIKKLRKKIDTYIHTFIVAQGTIIVSLGLYVVNR